ncbi:hypothetical protein LCGC14_1467110 [marine sediment metagenome]|uniref:SpoVT-AbrB domain-containing protein n=1 Tax=marine sediment metagenome TaxID=412755 RepID=A0A0F9MFD3_9ZZZZ
MPITEEELDKIIKTDYNIEKVSNICSDGKNLLTRIPKEVADFLNLEKKKCKIKWLIDVKTKQLKVEIIKDGI